MSRPGSWCDPTAADPGCRKVPKTAGPGGGIRRRESTPQRYAAWDRWVSGVSLFPAAPDGGEQITVATRSRETIVRESHFGNKEKEGVSIVLQVTQLPIRRRRDLDGAIQLVPMLLWRYAERAGGALCPAPNLGWEG